MDIYTAVNVKRLIIARLPSQCLLFFDVSNKTNVLCELYVLIINTCIVSLLISLTHPIIIATADPLLRAIRHTNTARKLEFHVIHKQFQNTICIHLEFVQCTEHQILPIDSGMGGNSGVC